MKKDKRRHLNYRIGNHIVEQRIKKIEAKKMEETEKTWQKSKRRSDIQITPKKINKWLNE
jgi:hypothetical protein